jgi:NAD(P)H-binding
MRSLLGAIVVLLAAVHLMVLASCHEDDDADDISDAAAAAGSGGIVLVLGATGRTGSLLYHELVQMQNNSTNNVRALVRSVDKAREILHCKTCDEQEGIFVGDIQNLTSLLTSGAFEHVQTVAIATGVTGQESPPPTTREIEAIEYIGIQNAVRSLATAPHRQRQHQVRLKDRRVVLCSSRGTTTPPSSYSSKNNKMFGDILFYKLNAESFLGSIGMGVTSIVKPCGLSNDDGNNRTLLALHDDAPTPTGSQMIPRADVARVMAHLVMFPPRQNLRFDLCSIDGPTTVNLNKLVESAKWDWEQHSTDGTGTLLVKESHEQQQTAKIKLHDAAARTMQNVPSRSLAPK